MKRSCLHKWKFVLVSFWKGAPTHVAHYTSYGCIPTFPNPKASERVPLLMWHTTLLMVVYPLSSTPKLPKGCPYSCGTLHFLWLYTHFPHGSQSFWKGAPTHVAHYTSYGCIPTFLNPKASERVPLLMWHTTLLMVVYPLSSTPKLLKGCPYSCGTLHFLWLYTHFPQPQSFWKGAPTHVAHYTSYGCIPTFLW